MLPVWSEAPDSRPSFDEICATLDREYGQTQEGYYYGGNGSVTTEGSYVNYNDVLVNVD